MDVNFVCPFCGKRLTLDQRCVGREVQCPLCNSVFVFKDEMIERATPRQTIPVSGTSLSNHQQPSRNTVTFEVNPIGFWPRVAAALIDALVTTIAAAVMVFITGLVLGIIGGDVEFWVQIVGAVTSWFYYAFMETSSVQATLGKLMIGAKVVDVNGERLTFGRATGRHFAKYLSAFLLCVGYIMVAFDEHKRGLHDLMAGTYVVSR